MPINSSSFYTLQFSFTIGMLLCAAALLSMPQAAAQADDSDEFKYIEVKVLDPDGKPFVDANVEVSMDGVDFPLMTDEEGIAGLNVQGTVERSLTLGVRQDGYAAVGARWNKGDKVPEELTITVEKGTTIGGIVHDEQGNPIEGVEVQASMAYRANDKPGQLRPWMSGTIGTTDAEGRWRNETAPSKESDIYLRFQHADYINDNVYGRQKATWEQLKSLEHVFVLKKGIEIRGRVLDTDGQPIAGAKVAAGSSRFGGSSFVAADANENGEYLLKNVQAGSSVLTVYAEHYSPDLVTIEAQPGMEPIDLELEPGHSIVIRATDPDGEPISGVWLAPDTWRGHRSVGGVMPRFETDADGYWESDSMPDDVIQYSILKQGHMSLRDHELVAREEEYAIVLPEPLVVEGKVVDAETGEPIEEFQAIHGIRWRENDNQVHWERHDVQQGREGKYRVEDNEQRFGHLVRIEAVGYRPGISRLVKSDEGTVTIDFELEVGSGPSGVVKTPSGELAEEADVVIAMANQHVQIQNGQFQQHSNAAKVETDSEGRFSLPFPDSEYAVVFLHESGWKQLSGSQLEESGNVTLDPWSQVEGKLLQGQEPLANEQIYINTMTPHRRGQPQVHWAFNTLSASDGTFSFDRVRSGDVSVARHIMYGDTGGGARMGTYTHRQQIHLEPGETSQVQIGGEGNVLQGRLVVPDDYDGEVVWSMGVVRINGRSQQSASRNPLQALGKAIAQLGQKSASADEEKPAKPKMPRSYATPIAKDGTFVIHDVMPGQYQMNVQILEPPSGATYRWNPIATLNQPLTVDEPAPDSEGKPIDLGDHELTMAKPKPPAAQTGDRTSVVLPSP